MVVLSTILILQRRKYLIYEDKHRVPIIRIRPMRLTLLVTIDANVAVFNINSQLLLNQTPCSHLFFLGHLIKRIGIISDRHLDSIKPCQGDRF